MNGREGVFLHGLFGDQDGVFVVVAAPGHEGDDQVFTKGQCAVIDAGAVSEDVALLHDLAGHAGGLLAEAGVLVGLVELEQIVGLDAARGGEDIAFVLDHDAVSIGVAHDAVCGSHDAGAGVTGHGHFHARADDGQFGAEQGHGLSLHVGTHEGAVCVIVFEEGNEGCRNGDHLAGSHVHKGDFFFGPHFHFALDTHGDVVIGKPAVLIKAGVGLFP